MTRDWKPCRRSAPPSGRRARRNRRADAGETDLVDIFNLRLNTPKFGLPIAAAPHCVQCASNALKAGMDEETVLACLLHDVGLAVVRPDHGWWGAQLVEPYVAGEGVLGNPLPPGAALLPGRVSRLRISADVRQDVRRGLPAARIHRRGASNMRATTSGTWPPAISRCSMTTASTRTSRGRSNRSSDIIGRHFRQPKEGLGNDSSATAHMWRTLIDPSKPL